MRECFCFGSEAVNASGEAVKGLVKSRVEFPPAQISGVFCFVSSETKRYCFQFRGELFTLWG